MRFSFKDKINFYDDFKKFYVEILDDFKFNYTADVEARNFLHKVFLKKSKRWDLENVLNSLNNLIQSRAIILVYGCGPSLEETIQYILNIKGYQVFHNFINICADGASRLLREKQIPVEAIFTDLDGITEKEFYYSKFVIVHAHGDNLDKLHNFEKHIIKFKNIIGTTQVEPFGDILNHGGFTDGDRILFFLKSLLSPDHEIYLLGMDFDDIIGKYSKVGRKVDYKASKIKKKKLAYAKMLLQWIQNKIKSKIYYVNSGAKNSSFLNITLDEFKSLVLDNY